MVGLSYCSHPTQNHESEMFRRNNAGRRTCLSMDKNLLEVQWRFLPNSSDEEPGFCTAWMRQRSLKMQADCREQEYRNKALARFANELGMTSLPSHVSNGEHDCSEGDDEAEEERDDIETSMETTLVSSQPPVDESPIRHDRPIPSEAPHTATWGTPSQSLMLALKEGGVRLDDLQGGDTRHTEDNGEWDGVDLASAPCLQPQVVGAQTLSPYLETANETQVNGFHQRAKEHSVRPSTPPGLLVYKPCLSVRVAEDIPSELQGVPKILNTAATGLERLKPSESAFPQLSNEEAEGEAFESSTKARLRIGLSLNQLSPKRPKGARPREGGRVMRKHRAELPNVIPSTQRSSGHATSRESVGRYGRAWYVNPELWGLESSQVKSAILDQEADNAEGMKQLDQATESMKAAIPGLFSAVRFVAYIRQQGVRMPAHLESTDRAMKAGKTRIGQDRRARMEDQDSIRDKIGDFAESGCPRTRWRARINAAVTLKQKKNALDSCENTGSETN